MQLVTSYVAVVLCACLSIPFGVAVNVSPGLSGIALLAVVYSVVKVVRLSYNECLAISKLHWYACQVMRDSTSGR